MAEIDIIGFLNKVKEQGPHARQIIEQNNFVFDDFLNDRWQKLAFTFYTGLWALTTDAEQILEALAEGDEANIIPQKG